MSVTFEFGHGILCLETLKIRKKIQLEKKVKNNFFSSCLSSSFVLYTLIISKSTNNFEKKFTYQGRYQRVDPILTISKKLAIDSFYESLTKT